MIRKHTDTLIVFVAMILFILAITIPPAAWIGGGIVLLAIAFGGDA